MPRGEAEYEAAKQKFAYSRELPVPCVYNVTEIDGRQALIMEYVEGKTLGSIILEDMSAAEYCMDSTVDLQIKLHGIDAGGLELMTDKLKRQISGAKELDEKKKFALIEKLLYMGYSSRLCHGDFHFFNLILSKNGLTVIDWADASAGDPKADACRSYLLYTRYSSELAELYIKSFCENSGYGRDAILAWQPIIAGAALSEMASAGIKESLIGIVNRYV